MKSASSSRLMREPGRQTNYFNTRDQLPKDNKCVRYYNQGRYDYGRRGAQHGVRTLRGRQFRAVSCLCPSPDPRPGPLLCTGDQGVDCSLEAGGPCRGSRRLGRVGLKLPQTSSRTPALGTTALGQEDSRVLSPSLSPASWRSRRSRASLAYLTVYIPFWKMCSFIRCCACTGHAAGARIRHDPWVWTPWSRN